MAKGSKAAAQQRLSAASYVTRLAQHGPRCSNCRHVGFPAALMSTTQHDRYCKLLQAGVKTHGGCRMYKPSVE